MAIQCSLLKCIILKRILHPCWNLKFFFPKNTWICEFAMNAFCFYLEFFMKTLSIDWIIGIYFILFFVWFCEYKMEASLNYGLKMFACLMKHFNSWSSLFLLLLSFWFKYIFFVKQWLLFVVRVVSHSYIKYRLKILLLLCFSLNSQSTRK